MKLKEIKDIESYRASDQSDIVLKDDLRLVAAWYSTL